MATQDINIQVGQFTKISISNAVSQKSPISPDFCDGENNYFDLKHIHTNKMFVPFQGTLLSNLTKKLDVKRRLVAWEAQE